MTEEELDRHRLVSEAMAARTVANVCAVLLRAVLPDEAAARSATLAAVRRSLDQAEADLEGLTIPGTPAVVSNMLADLWHEAFARETALLMKRLEE